MEKLKLEFANNSLPEDIWYPQQVAIKMKFDLLWEAGQQKEAYNFLKAMETYSNPRDVTYMQEHFSLKLN